MAEFLFTPSPAKEAVEFIRSKPIVSRQVFDELLPEVKALAFTITGIEDAEVMQRVRDRIADLPAGADWNAVKKDIVNEISPWLDAGKEGTLASQRRAEILMRQHGFQAYRSAQYETIQRTKHVLPYLQYIATQDEKTRSSHRVLHGIVLPADDPFWEQHTPPWDWGCRCQVVQISEREKERLEREDADKPKDHRRVLDEADRNQMNDQGNLNRALPPGRNDAGKWGVPQNVDVRSPEQAGRSGPRGAANLRPPIEELQKKYDADIWERFEGRMRETKIGENAEGEVTAWDWLNGAKPEPQVAARRSLIGSPGRDAARPAMSPAQGTAVKSRVSLRAQDPDVRASYTRTMDAIDRVHGDGPLPVVPLHAYKNLNDLGQITITNGTPARIHVQTGGPWRELTIAHEVGHLVDWSGIGEPGQFASASGGVPGLMDAIESSATVRALKAAGLHDYWTDPEELFARAYAQYITLRSGDETMRGQLLRVLALSKYRQWPEDDFVAIAAELDTLFINLKWRAE